MRNQDRIEKALAMLAREYPDHDLDADVGDTTPEPGRAERVEVSLIDCLADLRHFAFVSGVNWEEVNEIACKHFREEIDEGAESEAWREQGCDWKSAGDPAVDARVFNVNAGDVMDDGWILTGLDGITDHEDREALRGRIAAGEVVVTTTATGKYLWKILEPDDQSRLSTDWRSFTPDGPCSL